MQNQFALLAFAGLMSAAGAEPESVWAGGTGRKAANPAVEKAATRIRLISNFEANEGQYPPEVKFAARTVGGTLLLTGSGHMVSTGETVVRYRLLGAVEGAGVSGEERAAEVSHYFVGSGKSSWRTGVESYKKVRYRGIYPGIDLVHYRTAEGDLEHDFVVSAGADPAQIRFRIEGAETEVAASGDLQAGPVTYRKPVVYQVIDGEKRQVDGSYRSRGGETEFVLGRYDVRHELVIDPVVGLPVRIGGNNFDAGFAAEYDAAGNLVIGGATRSPNFPVAPGAPAAALKGNNDVFVTRLSPNGRTILSTTILGGSANDLLTDLKIARDGTIVIVGRADSTDFPVQAALQSRHGGGAAEGFFGRLSADGSRLISSSFLGGMGGELISRVALDRAGNLILMGLTDSTNFPTTSGVVQTSVKGRLDCFVTRVNAAGTQTQASTLFGGSENDLCNDMTVNASGDVFLAGETFSGDLPVTAGALQTSFGRGGEDGFLARLSANLARNVYATYIGGSNVDAASSVFVDDTGNAWVGGITFSSNFPISPAARNRGFRAPATGWFGRVNTGPGPGPLRTAEEFPVLNATAEPPAAGPIPNETLLCFTQKGKKATHMKMIETPFGPLVGVIVLSEEDGEVFSELQLYDPTTKELISTMDISEEAQDFACSPECERAEPPSSSSTRTASAARRAGPENCPAVVVGTNFDSRNPSAADILISPLILGGIPGLGLLVTKQSIPEKVCPDQVFYYEVAVTNNSLVTARNVEVVDTMPVQATFLRTSRIRPGPDPRVLPPVQAEANCTRNGNVLTCNLGDLEPLETRRFYIFMRSPAQPGIKLTNIARAGASVAQEETTVEREADLDVSLTSNLRFPAQAGVGQRVDYTIRVQNKGPDAATDIKLNHILPQPDGDFTSQSDRAGGSCRAGGGLTVFCTLNSLPSGQSWTVRVSARPSIPGTARSYADVSAKECDPAFLDNRAGPLIFRVRGEHADIQAFLDQTSLTTSATQAVADLTATVFNAGANMAPITQLEIEVPNARTIQVLPPDDVSCSMIAGTMVHRCSLGMLRLGERKEVKFRVTSPPRVDYIGEVRASSNLQDPNPGNNSRQLQVAVTGPAPPVRVGGVGNSATGNPRTLVSGSDPAVFGTGFAAALTLAPPGTTLPFELGGVQVLINGIPAPLFFAAPNQVNFQTPWELFGQTEAELSVVSGGRISYSHQVRIADYDPGIFTTNQAGTGQGAILIAGTTSLAAPEGAFPGSRPVKRGEFLAIFCNGMGPVNDPPPTGVATPSDKLRLTAEQPTVTIGGVEQEVVFSGLAPGFVGLYQVNVRIRENTPAGDAVALVLTIADAVSNEVTVAVAPADQ